jgi:hypothetical protein
MKVILYLALAAALCAQTTADWKCHIIADDDDSTFEPAEPHPLKYFTTTRLQEMRKRIAGEQGVEPSQGLVGMGGSVRELGRIAGFSIEEVRYNFADQPRFNAKSILVKTGSDEYREIYHLEATPMGQVHETVLIGAGLTNILFTMYRTSGHPGSAFYDRFWIGKDGPVRADFKPIWQAVEKVVPKESFILDASVSSSAPTLTLSARIQDYNNDAASGHLGYADVRFNLNRGRAVVVGAKYQP